MLTLETLGEFSNALLMFEKMPFRKEKDPLKPKQPMSAFFLFSNERRASLVAENKNIVEVRLTDFRIGVSLCLLMLELICFCSLILSTVLPIQLAKIAGEEWKNMTEEQKGPYEEVRIHSRNNSKNVSFIKISCKINIQY